MKRQYVRCPECSKVMKRTGKKALPYWYTRRPSPDLCIVEYCKHCRKKWTLSLCNGELEEGGISPRKRLGLNAELERRSGADIWETTPARYATVRSYGQHILDDDEGKCKWYEFAELYLGKEGPTAGALSIEVYLPVTTARAFIGLSKHNKIPPYQIVIKALNKYLAEHPEAIVCSI